MAMITFEYARKCDPMLVFVELEGSKYGTPLKQMILPPSKIGGIVNGKFYTGTAAVTSYSNGVEVGFSMPDPMAHAIAFDEVKSMTFVTPTGAKHELSTKGLRPAVNGALDVCVSKVNP
ncbi:hypothetical protein ACMFLR_15945 [Delftia tsuruhatensis]